MKNGTKTILIILSILGLTTGHASEREGPLQAEAPDDHRRMKTTTTTTTTNSLAAATSERLSESERSDPKSNVFRRMFVKYKTDKGKSDILKMSKDTVIIKEFPFEKLFAVKLTSDGVTRFQQDKVNFETVELDRKLEGFAVEDSPIPNLGLDPQERVPWGIKMIQADQLEVGPHPVKVCIVDTGVAVDHPDLPRVNVTGDDATSKSGDVWPWKLDFNGHGTHVAGIISGLGNNSLGVRGAGRIPLHITRGLDDFSGGYESDVLDAVNQCVASGAKIINLSLGASGMSSATHALYKKVVQEQGCLVVAAAGNQGKRMHEFPASHPDVISVSAVYKWERYWEGSNYGDQVELAAPGFGILSTSTSRSAVHTHDFAFSADQLVGSRHAEVSGKLVDCGSGSRVCREARNGICLLSRDTVSLRAMMRNCRYGGAVGAIVFVGKDSNAEIGNARMRLPTVTVSTETGSQLKDSYLNTMVSIGHRDSDAPENSYAMRKGTSMAVPHVSAAAALVWSHFPNCTNHQIRYALDITAKDVGLSGCDWDYGSGIVKARSAYEWLLANDCQSGTFGLKPSTGGCSVV